MVTAKGELTLTELENRNNARNEALIREMQTIFKRSNFGQTRRNEPPTYQIVS